MLRSRVWWKRLVITCCVVVSGTLVGEGVDTRRMATAALEVNPASNPPPYNVISPGACPSYGSVRYMDLNISNVRKKII